MEPFVVEGSPDASSNRTARGASKRRHGTSVGPRLLVQCTEQISCGVWQERTSTAKTRNGCTCWVSWVTVQYRHSRRRLPL